MKYSKLLMFGALLAGMVFTLGCSDDDDGDQNGTEDTDTNDTDTSGNDDGEPLDGVFIQPYKSCVAPLADDPVPSDDGEVCTNVAISGATEEGRLFTDYGDCDVVLTQRPYWQRPPFGTTAEDDPRLSDDEFMAELEWLTSQVRASGCVCCHDRALSGRDGAVWDVSADGIWTDHLSDQGAAILAGAVSSEILGAFPPEENNGFDRYTTGVPTTDIARAAKLLNDELERRGITEEDIENMSDFGDFLFDILEEEPVACEGTEGVSKDGIVSWSGGGARYVYVTEPETKNPGVPPNMDKPKGTIWRLDVKASSEPLESGIEYGSVPSGSYQVIPQNGTPPDLETGKEYKLYVLKDILSPRTNCLFTAP